MIGSRRLGGAVTDSISSGPPGSFPGMRFTVRLRADRPWPAVLAVARHAAATGWDGIWFGDEPEPALECWAAVGALAAAIPGIRLGALVDDDRGRHPAVIAKLAATVDLASGGRVVLGLDPGSRPDAIARLAEACQVVKSLVGSDRTTLGGRFYQLHDAPLDPKPRQQPFPLMVWDRGNATAEVAARYATEWCLAGDRASLADQIAGVRRRCEETGRDPAELAISVRGADLGPLLEQYREVGVTEWVVPEAGRDELDRIITEMAPAQR